VSYFIIVQFQLEMGKSHYPLGRVGEVGDIANMVSFLASERSSFMSGEDIVMDGGRHLRF
jgi:NAD(P)-dependent dehydrogenase (short-subunit alcohol dehydrogenase family)